MPDTQLLNPPQAIHNLNVTCVIIFNIAILCFIIYGLLTIEQVLDGRI